MRLSYVPIPVLTHKSIQFTSETLKELSTFEFRLEQATFSLDQRH